MLTHNHVYYIYYINVWIDHSGVYAFNYTEHIRIYPLKDARRLRNSAKHWAYKRIRSSVTVLLSVCLSSIPIPTFGQASSPSFRPRTGPGVVAWRSSKPLSAVSRPVSSYDRWNTSWGSREERSTSQWTGQITPELGVCILISSVANGFDVLLWRNRAGGNQYNHLGTAVLNNYLNIEML